MATNKVTDDSFESDVLKSSVPVLVDFWAEWCGPCKQIAPALEDLANDMADKVVVAKVNIDENPTTPMKYGVRGIPTLMLFKDGQLAAQKVGTLQKSKLYEWVESALSDAVASLRERIGALDAALRQSLLLERETERTSRGETGVQAP